MARVLLLLILAALPAAADPPPRWKLDYEAEIPDYFEFEGAEYWGILFTLENKGPLPAPLAVGHEIRRDPGRLEAVAEALKKRADFRSFEVADALVDALFRESGHRDGAAALDFISGLVVRDGYDFAVEKDGPLDAEAKKRREAWIEWAKRSCNEASWDPVAKAWVNRGR